MIAFIFSAFIALVTAVYAIFQTDLVVFDDWTPIDDFVNKAFRRRPKRRSPVVEEVIQQFLLGLSDQHMFFGAAILTTGFIQHCSISVYIGI